MKLGFWLIGALGLTLILSGSVFAQADGHTAREEAEGKIGSLKILKLMLWSLTIYHQKLRH